MALSSLLAGCVVGPRFHTPAPPTVDRYTPAPLAPVAGGESAGSPAPRFVSQPAAPRRWWTLLGSTELDALEEEALKANPTLAAAKAALRQARETYLAQRASLYPTVTLAAGASRARNSLAIAPPLNNGAQTYSLYNAQVGVSYVLDVFGGERRGVESAAATAEAQAYETDAADLTLTANVASSALQLASLNDQLAQTARIVDADRRVYDITARQQSLGEASGADVAVARAALAQAQQLGPALRKQADQQRDLLAALVGRPPSEAPTRALSLSDFTLPADLPVSLPADLVRQRPDVRAAEASVHVASAEVGVALAARLPSITLNGIAGGASTDVSSLLSTSNTLWSIAGDAAQTVFDAGALRHKQRAAEAALDQAMAQYRAAVLTGLVNTADSLQAIVDDAAAAAAAQAAADASARSLQIARAQFEQGQASFLTALAADSTDSQSEVSLIQARAARLIDTVALYQALGGGELSAAR